MFNYFEYKQWGNRAKGCALTEVLQQHEEISVDVTNKAK